MNTDKNTKEATIWFLTVTDERDALVSSPLMFPNIKSNPEAGK